PVLRALLAGLRLQFGDLLREEPPRERLARRAFPGELLDGPAALRFEELLAEARLHPGFEVRELLVRGHVARAGLAELLQGLPVARVVGAPIGVRELGGADRPFQKATDPL